MSATETRELQLPDIKTAANVLDGLYAEVFFSKLAEYGFTPESEEGAIAMLKTAAWLDKVDNSQSVAQADPYVQAGEKLASLLRGYGIDTGEAAIAAHNKAAEIKQAAYAIATNPDIYASVLASQLAVETTDDSAS